MKLRIALFVGLATLVFQGGCGYHLGSMLPEGVDSVYVPAVINKSREPLLEIETTRSLLQELRTDGSLKVTDESSADSTLEVTIRDYKVTPVVYERTDRLRPNEMRFTLIASFKLTDNRTGAVITSSALEYGDALSPFLSDLTSAKRQALPEVAGDLAHDIVERIVDHWPDHGPGAGTPPR